ncbi:hypothetical protein BDR03DRAFT_962466 [Suillus americanus]|nr:hypothetical protein BDR03DRAFT_962466 [Suillus americanus]
MVCSETLMPLASHSADCSGWSRQMFGARSTQASRYGDVSRRGRSDDQLARAFECQIL